jgi:hypothetical protein
LRGDGKSIRVQSLTPVDWMTLLATVAGGAAALLGTVVAHLLGTREDRRRENSADRRAAYVEFLVALDAGFARLRQLADPDDPPKDLEIQTRYALGNAGVYETREKLLLVGNPAVQTPAQRTLERLNGVRRAIRDGAKLQSMAYHNAYHPFAEALWRLRAAIRHDLGATGLTPEDVGKESWDSQANCSFCRQHLVPAPAQPSA